MFWSNKRQKFERSPSHVCKLKKTIYGLKQAHWAWFQKLTRTLLEWGFKHSKSDLSLLIYTSLKVIVLLLIYVDNIVLIGSDLILIAKFIKDLDTWFALKDMGQLHYFFGLEVQSTLDGLHLTQAKYIHDLFNKTRMIGATPMPTLCEGGLHLSKHDDQPLDNRTHANALLEPYNILLSHV